MMFIKIHKSYRDVVALADSEIIGKVFEEGIKQIRVRESFFKGDKKNRGEVLGILKKLYMEDVTFNIVGKKSVEVAIEACVIKEQGVIKIDGVPVALGLL